MDVEPEAELASLLLATSIDVRHVHLNGTPVNGASRHATVETQVTGTVGPASGTCRPGFPFSVFVLIASTPPTFTGASHRDDFLFLPFPFFLIGRIVWNTHRLVWDWFRFVLEQRLGFLEPISFPFLSRLAFRWNAESKESISYFEIIVWNTRGQARPGRISIRPGTKRLDVGSWNSSRSVCFSK